MDKGDPRERAARPERAGGASEEAGLKGASEWGTQKDPISRAEELLEERRKTKSNAKPGAPVLEGENGGEGDDKVETLTNDLRRMAADFANYRKRNEAERAEFVKYAKTDLILKLLDVLDGYDRALETVPDEVKKQPWVEGMWLVERKLRSILEAEGLVPVDSVGQPFDPFTHEAVMTVESDQPEGTVLSEFQKAYRLHDRVIRPALVTVAQPKRKEN